MAEIGRRDFVKLALGTGGLTAIVLGAKTMVPSFLLGADNLQANTAIRLSMEEVLAEMVDATKVYMRAFQEAGKEPHIPGPVIIATEGDTVNFEITNNLLEEHTFSVFGGVASQAVGAGETVKVGFPAPRAGTYLYGDSADAPINRVLGLHGVMAVLPASGSTPYSDATAEVQQLFNDLGTPPFFPGRPWTPDRTMVWVCNEIDPFLNERIQQGEKIPPEEFVRSFLPRYFTLNGKSGFFAAHDKDCAPHGNVGEPMLIRTVNAGLATHSLHPHGNHVFVLSVDNVVQDNVILLDTFPAPPLTRRDILFPFVKPPDIPRQAWPPREEKFPLKYPMHCHMEMSQTAGGGNYPQGLVTDIVFEGILPEVLSSPDSGV